MTALDWDALRSFLAVARAGRLTVAARQLEIDHSTLSRRMTALEKVLQARLFDRGATGYALTAQGERLLAHAQEMESIALGVVGEIAGASRRIAGTVRVGAPDGFGTFFLAAALGRLSGEHPELAVQLITMPRVFSLSKREADLAIGLARPTEGRLRARKLTDYELGLYASHDYLRQAGAPAGRAELHRHRLIGYIDDQIYAPELNYLPLIAPDLRPGLTSANLAAQFAAVRAGHGLCVLPCFMADEAPALARVLTGDVALIRSFWLIVHADLAKLARVAMTAEFIAEATRAARRRFVPSGGE
jgi:DNA-binding transcriptional LysR family regulator